MDDLNQAFRIIEIYQVLKPLEILLCTLKKKMSDPQISYLSALDGCTILATE